MQPDAIEMSSMPTDQFGEQAPDEFAVPAGWVLIEDDMLVRSENYTRGWYQTNSWPAGVIPYEFSPEVDEENMPAVRAAMDIWESLANLEFRPRIAEADYVRVINSGQPGWNFSAVGRQGGAQELGISNWNRPTLLHELGHALGYNHEHTRDDRDQYIEIISENICLDCCSHLPCHYNFLTPLFTSRFGPYDFESIMHYGECTFSRCGECNDDPESCRTMLARPGYEQWQTTMGHATTPSYWDMRVMTFLYPYPGWRFVRDSGSDSEGAGTFVSPWQTFDHGYEQTPSGGTLWILEGRTISGARTMDRPITFRAARGDVLFQ